MHFYLKTQTRDKRLHGVWSISIDHDLRDRLRAGMLVLGLGLGLDVSLRTPQKSMALALTLKLKSLALALDLA